MNKIIFYGAGQHGEQNYQLMKKYGLENIIFAFCDKNAYSIKTKHDIPVLPYKEAKALNLPFVISVYKNNTVYDEIKNQLNLDNITYYDDISSYLRKHTNMVEINRDACASYHITNMDKYFDSAETDALLNTFWANNSLFYKLFQKLDLTNVVELACGRGRHVPKYISKSKQITLVDILEKNIDIVKDRFKEYKNIHYYQNNGYDLSKLENEQYTSLFTYDAMVHFELLDIYNYLKETYRILSPGGYALFHHSNDSSDYTNSFTSCSNEAGRNFMDKKLFAYLAYRAGFEIVEQHIIDWGKYKKLDCISLLRK